MFSVFSIVANATSQMFSVWFSNKKADQKLRGNFFRKGRYWGSKTAKYQNCQIQKSLKGADSADSALLNARICSIILILEYHWILRKLLYIYGNLSEVTSLVSNPPSATVHFSKEKVAAPSSSPRQTVATQTKSCSVRPYPTMFTQSYAHALQWNIWKCPLDFFGEKKNFQKKKKTDLSDLFWILNK